MNRLMFAVAVTSFAGVLCAQEAGPASVAASDEIASAQVAANADGGQQIADTAVEKGAELAAAEPSKEFVAAEDRVLADLDKIGLSLGYVAEKKAIIQMGVAAVKVEDPANDATFGVIREQTANIAYLNAKAEVIKAINADFSAIDRVMLSMDETIDATAEKVAAAKDALEAKKAELAEALSKYDATASQIVADVTINDRFGAFMDGVIKKIDTSYDPAAIAAAKKIDAAAAKAESENLKAKANDLYAQYKELEKAAAQLPKDPAMGSESVAKIMSKMPLLGSSVLTQAESWDPSDKVYSVAIAIVWSPKLQESAVKIGTGDFSGKSRPGKFSPAQWVKAQDWRTMVGARRFTDDKGRNLFIGISSVELTGPVVKQNAKKKIADTMAIKNVAMSLLGDLETYREASQNLKVYADDSAGVAQRLTENTSAKVDVNLKGCMQLASKTVRHPITGKKIYVSAYYIDPTLSAEAGNIMKKLYADSIRTNKHTQKERGKHAGMQSASDSAKEDKSPYVQGAAEGKADVNKTALMETDEKDKAPVAKPTAQSVKPIAVPVAPAPAKGTSTGGTFSNSANLIDTNF